MISKPAVEKNQILVSAAVIDELNLILDAMEDRKTMDIGGRAVFSGIIGNYTVTGVITGAGVVNTAQALTSCIEAFTPSIIIQTGCGGVFAESGASIGDVAIADCEIDIHSGIETRREDGGFIVEDLPFPLISKNNREIKNRYQVNESLSKAAFAIINNFFNNELYNIHYGHFITVSTITASDSRAKLLHDVYDAFMESMEGASAAHIATHYNIPFIEIRAASNMVGKRDKSKWNLPLAFKQCNKAVLAVIHKIDLSVL